MKRCLFSMLWCISSFFGGLPSGSGICVFKTVLCLKGVVIDCVKYDDYHSL